MSKRWFMSYAHVYTRGAVSSGHNVYEGDEHPLARAGRRTADYGSKDGFRVVVLSFQDVGPDGPEYDVLSVALTGK